VREHTANLVYCAPTSGGKSLVAEVLVATRLLLGAGGGGGGGCLALVVLPFVSLCQAGG